MDITIRKYDDDDLDQVNNILFESFNIRKNNFNNNDFVEIVAISDDKVVGYLLLTKVFNPVICKYYYLVDYVCVLSNYRNNGTAYKMMMYAEDIVRDNSASYMQLTCSTFRIEAHKLYEKCGFIKRDSDLFRKEIL